MSQVVKVKVGGLTCMIFRYMLFQYQKQRLFYGVYHRKYHEWTSVGMREDCDLWASNGLKLRPQESRHVMAM